MKKFWLFFVFGISFLFNISGNAVLLAANYWKPCSDMTGEPGYCFTGSEGWVCEGQNGTSPDCPAGYVCCFGNLVPNRKIPESERSINVGPSGISVNFGIGTGGSSNNPLKMGSEQIFQKKEYTGGLPDYSGGATDGGEHQIRAVLRETVMPAIKRFLIPIAILFLSWSGISLFLSRGDEEDFKKKFRQGLSVMTGFFLFALATNIIDWVFFGTEGQIFRGDDSSSYAKWGVMEMAGLFKFASSFAVIIAVVYIIFTAFQLIVHGEDEGEIAKIKKRLVYTVVGIGVLLSANWVVIFMVDSDGKVAMPSVKENISLAMTWANVILGFIGVAAVVSLVWGGFRLISNFGDDQAAEEAKKTIMASVIGLVVAFSAWTIIYFMLSPT